MDAALASPSRTAGARRPGPHPLLRVLLVLVVLVLVAGLAGGLLRAGVALPVSQATSWIGAAAGWHAALMVSGFMGSLIGIERAIALRQPIAWCAPALSAAAAAALLLGFAPVAATLFVAASLVFVAVHAMVLRREPAAHTALLLVAACSWLVGNLLAWRGPDLSAALPWWFSFLLLTVAAERLEMTRLMRRRPAAQPLLAAVVATLLGGAALSGPAPLAGGLAFGVALVLLAAWLLTFDIARRTVTAQGLPRYMALCLLGGYLWLAIAGLAWAAMALGAPTRDAALHAIGLGFLGSMVLGHAPVILPAVARIKLAFGRVFYLPLLLLHLSLLARFGPGMVDAGWRAGGALGNVLALAVFAMVVVGAAFAWRRREAAQAARGAPQVPSAFALWQLGFRPFYLLAGAFSALSIALWGLQSTGALAAPYLPGPLWHAHEMLFGFALPVIVGFLFTAGRNWSQRPTPTGLPLAGLALLWLAGRVLVLSPYGWWSALANTAFPLAAALGIAVPFVAAGNRRNYFFIGLLVAMAGATLAVHLNQLGLLVVPGWAGIRLAMDVVLFILCVMGGRVIPMFTNNGVPGAGARRHPLVEKLALGSVLALLVADLVRLPDGVVLAVAAVAALSHLARWLLWQPWRTLRAPVVWVLHLAYAWVPLHLALRAAALAGMVGPSAATHALTTGAVGGLVIGMMTRTSRGHTGRPLRADRVDVACYLLVAAAALVRVLVPLAMPTASVQALALSAALWSCGFALFTVHYWPVLTRPRLDGLPG